MRRKQYWAYGALSFVAVSLLALLPFSAQAEDAEVGQNAPGFKLVGSDGKEYTLAQFKGEKPVILAFFPKSFTPG